MQHFGAHSPLEPPLNYGILRMTASPSQELCQGERRKGMTTPKRIREFWAPLLVWIGKVETADDVLKPYINGQHCCFRCGNPHVLERAHIHAVTAGGSNRSANLHLLCRACHTESEMLPLDQYWRWFSHTRFEPRAHLLRRAANRCGFVTYAAMKVQLDAVPKNKRRALGKRIARYFGTPVASTNLEWALLEGVAHIERNLETRIAVAARNRRAARRFLGGSKPLGCRVVVGDDGKKRLENDDAARQEARRLKTLGYSARMAAGAMTGAGYPTTDKTMTKLWRELGI